MAGATGGVCPARDEQGEELEYSDQLKKKLSVKGTGREGKKERRGRMQHCSVLPNDSSNGLLTDGLPYAFSKRSTWLHLRAQVVFRDPLQLPTRLVITGNSELGGPRRLLWEVLGDGL
ncbi:hypothetical protein N7523_010611 [Penicillium sp. IBT 18751x]|nr:hypothetical protein N7523_010611 [Penicillium sp. IBT 18751x]